VCDITVLQSKKYFACASLGFCFMRQ